MPELTLAERLVRLKGPCPDHHEYRGAPGTSFDDTRRVCENCNGTGAVFVLPDCVRIAVESDHYLPLHGIGVEDTMERVSCAKAGCSGEHFEASTRAEDWGKAWGQLAPRRSISLTFGANKIIGEIALLDRFEGESIVDVLQQAIAALLKERGLL